MEKLIQMTDEELTEYLIKRNKLDHKKYCRGWKLGNTKILEDNSQIPHNPEEYNQRLQEYGYTVGMILYGSPFTNVRCKSKEYFDWITT